MPRRKPRTKKGNGEGTFYPVGEDRWEAAITMPRRPGEKRTRLKVRCRTREEAINALADLRDQVRRTVSVAQRMTLRDAADLWMKTAKLEDSTKAGYEFALRYMGHIGSVQVHRLTPLAFANWYAEKKQEAGERTMQVCASVVKRVCEYAATLGIVRESPFVLKVARAKRKDINPFTADEVARILAATSADRVGGYIDLAFICGLRQGELSGLQWHDYDRKTHDLIIRRQVIEVSGGTVVKEPKTKRSIRRIHLPAPAVESIERRLALAESERRGEPGDFVFPTSRGSAMRRSNFGNRHWRPLLENLDLVHRGLHHARHTCASLMLMRGLPVQFVSEYLGHANPTITWETYSHFLPGSGKAIASSLDEVWRGLAVAPSARQAESAVT